MQRLITNDNGQLTGGFASIRGGFVEQSVDTVGDNSHSCSNSLLCTGSNSGGCSNSIECGDTTNNGNGTTGCTNSKSCVF